MKTQAERDAFDPELILPKSAADDAFAKFVVKNWKNIAWTLGAIAVAIYFYRSFESTRIASLEAAADLYSNVRSQYQTVVSSKLELDKQAKDPQAAKPVDAQSRSGLELAKEKYESESAKLKELLTALSDRKDPYAKISIVYKGLLAAQSGDLEALKGIYESFNWKSFIKDSSPERFFSELLALVYAKTLIDFRIDEARQLLLELGQKSFFVNLSAANALFKIADTESAKSEAQALLSEIKKLHPEQNELLGEESF